MIYRNRKRHRGGKRTPLKTKEIPCVFVTASATDDQLERLKSSDACGYVTKPINTRTFVEQIVGFATA